MKGGKDSYIILGCMDLDYAFAIPREVIIENLNNLNMTTKVKGESYWHITLTESPEGTYQLTLPKIRSHLDLEQFKFSI